VNVISYVAYGWGHREEGVGGCSKSGGGGGKLLVTSHHCGTQAVYDLVTCRPVHCNEESKRVAKAN